MKKVSTSARILFVVILMASIFSTQHVSAQSVQITNLFPNPAKEKLTVSVSSAIDDSIPVEIRVSDILGLTRFFGKVTIKHGAQNIQIDIGDFSDGRYFLSVIVNSNGIEERLTKAFVKSS